MNIVDDRLKKHHPSINVLKRRSTRSFAGISTHTRGNVFDYLKKRWKTERMPTWKRIASKSATLKHIALRAVEPAGVAKFYRDVFELAEMEKPADDPNFYLSDGTVVFVIMPWNIMDYAGTGIERPALDHVGFKVESVQR